MANPDNFEADTQRIRTLADTFEGHKDTIDQGKSGLADASITAGSFDVAQDLETVVHDRRDALTTNLTGLSKAFDIVGTTLYQIAQEYDNTAADNEAVMSHVNQIVTAIDSHLPGFKDFNDHNQPS